MKTQSRLGATSAYRVVLPVAAYFTWHGTTLEGRRVVPGIEEPLSPEALLSGGEDNQLRRALKLLSLKFGRPAWERRR